MKFDVKIRFGSQGVTIVYLLAGAGGGVALKVLAFSLYSWPFAFA